MPALSIDACQQCTNDATGLLHAPEARLLKQWLRSASSYLEWGAGTSTVLALTTHGQRVVHTIENQDGLCSVIKMRADMLCIDSCTNRASSFQLHCVRDGAQTFGYHFDHNLSLHSVPRPYTGKIRIAQLSEIVLAREQGFHYVRLASDLQSTFDLILVDGR